MLASICAQLPIPRFADRLTVAPILMGRRVSFSNGGAMNVGNAPDCFLMTEICSVRTGDPTGAVGDSTKVDVSPGTGCGLGALWRKPVNGVGWTAPAVPAARKNPRATAVRVLIVAPPAFLCCCETYPWAPTPLRSCGSSGKCSSRAEIDGAAARRPQLAHQVVHGPGVGVELGRHDADEADQVGVAATEAGVAVSLHQLVDAGVLALLAAAVQRLDGDHAVQRALGLVVRAQPHVRTSRVAGQRDPSEPVHLADELLRRQADVGEVEAGEDVRVHAVDQDVTVVGLDLGGIQDQQAVAVLQLAEVALQIELAVLGEHDAVERSLGPLALQQLQVRLDRRPAVVRALRVQMQIENHATGWN